MKIDWKEVLISIFIGAVVAFVTVFLEGVVEVLKRTENNLIGGATSTLYYLSKHLV